MRKKDNAVKNDETKELESAKVKKPKDIKGNIARYEGMIVVLLAALCLTGILFVVQASRATEEVLPQEGTSITDNKNKTEETVYFCEKDLDFNILDYATYTDFVNAGNTDHVYIVHDESNIVKNGEIEFLNHRFNNRRTETVRGITIGNTLSDLYATYGAPDRYDEYISDDYEFDGKEHKCVYMYIFRVDSVKDFFFIYTFVMDTNNEIIGIVLEPVSMEYWAEPSAQ